MQSFSSLCPPHCISIIDARTDSHRTGAPLPLGSTVCLKLQLFLSFLMRGDGSVFTEPHLGPIRASECFFNIHSSSAFKFAYVTLSDRNYPNVCFLLLWGSIACLWLSNMIMLARVSMATLCSPTGDSQT